MAIDALKLRRCKNNFTWGFGNVTSNMFAYELEDEILLIDCGMAFRQKICWVLIFLFLILAISKTKFTE